VTEAGTPVSPHATPLGYAAPKPPSPVVALYWVAYVCWILPLVAGVGALIGFAVTSARVFPMIGLLTIYGGVILLPVGLLCLGVFGFLLGRCDAEDRSHWSNRAKWLVFLLFMNIPAAFICVMLGARLLDLSSSTF
jgi:hypothetical protein